MNTWTWLVSTCALSALLAFSAAQAQTPSPVAASPAPVVTQPAKPSATAATDAAQAAEQSRQDTNSSSASSVAEVIVTAQKRAESSQSVPIALSVYSDSRRNLLGIEDGKDITNYTPSMSLNGEFLSLRGVGRYTGALGTDPGVAVYVDGIYTSSPDYLNQPDILTDRIEVLPGPQSTYGRNAIGGAVDVISKRPTDTFYAEGREGLTSYLNSYTDLVLSGPIVDTLKYRVSYAYSDQFDGFEKNLAPGYKDTNDGSSRLFEGQLEWNPISHLDLWLRYQNFGDNYRPQYGQFAGPYQSGSFNNYNGLVGNPQYGLAPNSNPALRNAFDVSLNDPGYTNITDDNTITAHVTYDLDGVTFRYLGGYSHYNAASDTDFDMTARTGFFYTPPGAATALIPSDYRNVTSSKKSFFSHEVNVSSDNSHALKWVGGIYYYWEENPSTLYQEDVGAAYFATPIADVAPFGPVTPSPQRAYYSQSIALKSESEAVYGQVDYDLNEKLRFTVSGRYNWDQKQGSTNYRYLADGETLTNGDAGAFALDETPPGAVESIRDSWSDWTGKVGAEYKFDRDTLGYVSATKGYKSGGFDLQNFTPIPVVAPETLYAYESGLKKIFNRSLLVNGDIYYYDYHNLQVPLSEASGSSGPSVVTQTLVNAQRVRTYGVELQSIWSPLENVHLTLTYSYLNAEFTKFTNQAFQGAGLVDTSTGDSYSNLNGNTVPQSPRNKVNFDPQYVFHLKGSDISVSANYAWIARQYYGVFNNTNYLAPSYYNLDFRVVWQPKNIGLTGILYARNVTNQVQINSYAPEQGNILSQSVYYTNQPRVVGGELQYRFR